LIQILWDVPEFRTIAQSMGTIGKYTETMMALEIFDDGEFCYLGALQFGSSYELALLFFCMEIY
jgi:hypothetical protein